VDTRMMRQVRQQIAYIRRQRQRREQTRWTLNVQHIDESDVYLPSRTSPEAVTHSIGIGKSLIVIHSPHGSEELVL
jgi:hypothetical protein